MTDKGILEKVDEAILLGRKQAYQEMYQDIKSMFEIRIRTHNRDFDNAESEQYKYDLSRDAREFNANFNMILDKLKEELDMISKKESE